MSVEKKIRKARTGLILDQPFFGSLALRMELIEDSKKVQTMGVDGKSIYYNPEFVKSLNPLELKGVLCHEVMHVVLMHHLRRDNRDPWKWNIATDYAINLILNDAGFTLPEKRLLDGKYKDKTAEEIYNLLPDQEKQESDPGGCGEVFDCPDKLSPADKTKLEQETKVMVQQAARQAETMGTLPSDLKRLVMDLTAPVINWRELLRRFIQDTAKNDFNWSRPNKRFIGYDLYLPSLLSNELKPVCLAVDTSGSIDDETLKDFSSELSAIMEEFETEISVIYCDTKIAGVEEFRREDLPLKLNPKGGGGTSFIPPFQWVDEKAKDIACMIYFTDLCCNDFPDEPGYPVLWIQHGDYGNDVPFGEVIKLK